MILVDASAWVEYDRATGSPVDQRLHHLVEHTHEVAVTEPVVATVVAGARDLQGEHDLRRLMARFHRVPFDAAHFESATNLHLRSRRAGVTPRGLLDCMVAAVALGAGVPILTNDRDVVRLAEVTGVALDDASPR